MERLTERENDKLIMAKQDNGEYIPAYWDEDNFKAIKKLADYEDLEEQGLLVRLPIKIGDDVYKIPSKTNYELNILNGHKEFNRIYHQKVNSLVFSQRGWFVQCDKASIYAPDVIYVDIEFGKTWFTEYEEAEKKFGELENDIDN